VRIDYFFIAVLGFCRYSCCHYGCCGGVGADGGDVDREESEDCWERVILTSSDSSG
jgi:hypothetical protein